MVGVVLGIGFGKVRVSKIEEVFEYFVFSGGDKLVSNYM